MTKSPLGGKKTGKNPTDRGKLGTKRSVFTDGYGVPLGVEVSGANTHDIQLLQATFDSVPIKRPQPTSRRHQHVCLGKGYGRRSQVSQTSTLPTSRQIAGPGRIAAEKKSAIRSTPMGRRANTFLDQPLSSAACPLGKESRQLSCHAASLIRVDHV